MVLSLFVHCLHCVRYHKSSRGDLSTWEGVHKLDDSNAAPDILTWTLIDSDLNVHGFGCPWGLGANSLQISGMVVLKFLENGHGESPSVWTGDISNSLSCPLVYFISLVVSEYRYCTIFVRFTPQYFICKWLNLNLCF
jgi:hypothetical protein